MALNDISSKSGGYNQRIEQWSKVRDVIEGEEKVQDRGTQYLPQPKGQDSSQYSSYKQRASFYGVVERTLRGMVGMVFRIEPIIELPPAIKTMTESATPDGLTLNTLMRDAVREVMSLGRFGMLVDMPTSPALAGKARPYIAPYTAENIWRWDEVFDHASGKRIVTRVVVREDPPTVDADVETIRLRELFLDGSGNYTQQLWIQETADTENSKVSTLSENEDVLASGSYDRDGPPVVPTMNGKPLKRIPFWFVNTFNLTADPCKSPMLDLANMNLAHYRNSADYEHSLFLTGMPTPWVTANWQDADVPETIGPHEIWKLPIGAAAGMLEFSGASISAIRDAMRDKEERMAVLGAQLIRDQQRANVTAETTKLQATEDESVLLAGVQTTETAFERCLAFASEWAGANPEAVSVEMNQDFVEMRLGAQELASLVAGWQSGAYSKQTLHENLQRGEIIPPSRSLEEEQELIDEEGPVLPVAAPVPGAPPASPPGTPTPPEEADEEVV